MLSVSQRDLLIVSQACCISELSLLHIQCNNVSGGADRMPLKDRLTSTCI